MRIAFIADGRAEHVRRWLRHLVLAGEDILLLSTYPCANDIPGVRTHVLPRLLRPGNALVKRSDAPGSTDRESLQLRLIRSGLYDKIWPAWQQATLLDVPLQSAWARRAIGSFRPRLVHAFRVQNEGYVAALTRFHPWILSVWGQDFVYFAHRYRLHNALTRLTMARPDALTADCQRDIHLAHQFGLDTRIPTRCFPGNGGVDLKVFRPGLPARERNCWVVYPRGLAPYLRVNTLLSAIHIILGQLDIPSMRFILLVPSSVVPIVRGMVDRMHLPSAIVEVCTFKSVPHLADLLRSSAMMVSPAISDGTPNSMLEAMACGAFPVIGDIESVREWLTHGVNGLLFDPNNPRDLAHCIRRAMDDWSLRQQAQDINLKLVQERADYTRVMPLVRDFYHQTTVRMVPSNR